MRAYPLPQLIAVAVVLQLGRVSSADPTTEDLCEDKECEPRCQRGDTESCFRAALDREDQAHRQQGRRAENALRRARELARKACRAGHLMSCAHTIDMSTAHPADPVDWPRRDKPLDLLRQWLHCEHRQREPDACIILHAVAIDALGDQCAAGVADACWRLHHYYRRELGEKLDAARKRTRGKLEKTDAQLAAMRREEACAASKQPRDCEPPPDTSESPDFDVACDARTSREETATESVCVDRKGRRQGPARENYVWGALQCSGQYRAGRKHGPWKCFWPDGSAQSIGTLVDGRVDGSWEFFYQGLGKAVALRFRRGIPHGSLAMWHAGGQRAIEGRFVDGQSDGAWTYWHPDGSVRARGRFTGGARDGEWSGWYSKGTLAVRISYRRAVADGAYETWFENGQAREKGRYRNGKRVGRWTQTCTGSVPSGSYDAEAAYAGGTSGHYCNLPLTF